MRWRSIRAERRFSTFKQRKGGALRQLRFARRRVPASDFRQFICRKSFYITGPPQNGFCGETELGEVAQYPGRKAFFNL